MWTFSLWITIKKHSTLGKFRIGVFFSFNYGIGLKEREENNYLYTPFLIWMIVHLPFPSGTESMAAWTEVKSPLPLISTLIVWLAPIFFVKRGESNTVVLRLGDLLCAAWDAGMEMETMTRKAMWMAWRNGEDMVSRRSRSWIVWIWKGSL